MKWKYLQVYLTRNGYIAHDGTSICDGDKIFISLLGRLGQDRWEYVQYVGDEEKHKYHLLKRSLP